VGAGYNSQEKCEIMSATAIRKSFCEKREFISVPSEVASTYERVVKEGKVLNYSTLAEIVHKDVLLHPKKISSAFDTTPEMASLINKEAKKCTKSLDFFFSMSSKICTTARIKRSLLYSLFGVKKIVNTPKFTVLLGMDEKGKKHLNEIRKQKKIEVITKHADGKILSASAKKDLERVYLVDSVYNTLLEKSTPAEDAYKKKPIIKK
jgi:predicted nucleotidyltransferase